MSYRAFKRLLGETSLERKCRFLFGAFILLMLTGSFWLYARQTEHLAYDQITTTCRLLVTQIVDHQLATGCRPPPAPPPADKVAPPRAADAEGKKMAQALVEFRTRWEKRWPEHVRKYRYWVIRPNPPPQDLPDHATSERLTTFRDNPDKQEDN